jgi:hypothetical protein
MKINFIARKELSKWPDIDLLTDKLVDTNFNRFRGAASNWIIQSFLILRPHLTACGFDVRIGERFVPGEICVCHRDDLNRLSGAWKSFVICARADRPAPAVADIVISQNDLVVNRSLNTFFIPHWPQPGLIPRNRARGTMIETAAYFGHDWSIPEWMKSEGQLSESLGLFGLKYQLHNKVWNDYGQVDIALAFRDEADIVLEQKPATKVTNAWLAGVIPIVYPEPEYARIVNHGVNGFLASTFQESVDWIKLLVREPEYVRAIQNAASDAAASYSRQYVTKQWMDFFIEEAIPRYRHWMGQGKGVDRLFRYLLRYRRQHQIEKLFYKTKQHQLEHKSSNA